ncbi:MAG: asparagine synthase (glutamine-hydrolyzing) [Pseudomonadales bacterium]
MCGIVGFWSTEQRPALQATSQAMADVIRHRGPDDSGEWWDESSGLALAHRRLAIQDLSAAGHQPMASPCGRFVLVFNGEIYNHLQLREEIDQVDWRGHSDTETLLVALAKWGLADTLARLNGMFAFALWDCELNQLSLARDRLGEKPLFYGRQGSTLFFTSEPKALRAHPHWHPQIDRQALTSYFRYQYVPAPHSIFSGLHKLPPGHYITLDNPGGALTSTCYWDIHAIVSQRQADLANSTYAERIAALESLLKDSVKLRMLADVPLGTFLSGGYDSSLVTALMQQQSTQPVKTFAIGFEDANLDEAPHARAVAYALGTDHTELYVTEQQAQSVIPELASIWCEPFADSSQIPTLLVSALAKRDVTVSLSGDGGDELFFGYHRYFRAQDIWRRIKVLPLPLRRLLRQLPMPARIARVRNLLTHTKPLLFYREFVSHWTNPEQLVVDGSEAATFFSRCEPNRNFADMMALADVVTYLPDDLLVKVDRASMAHSLEVRVPLLDHQLVEFALSLPMNDKQRGGSGKHMLKEIAHRHIPSQILDRPKMGFGIPLNEWLRGPLKDWASALLDPARIKADGYLNAELIATTWQQHLSGEQQWHYLLWDVLMFNAWLDEQARQI